MDIKWIEDFLTLEQTRNFSRSADSRNVTQSALSRRIQSLETWVGTDLVDRSTYPLTLTPAGKLFSESARDALRILNDSRHLLRQQRGNKNMLRVAAGHTLALNFFPMWVNGMLPKLGDIHAQISPLNVHTSVLSLIEGNVDLLLCYHHPALPIELDASKYEHINIGTETVIPVSVPNRSGRAAFALPGSKTHPTPRLSYPTISFLGRVVDYIQGHAGQPCFLTDSYESDMAELLKKMALSGHGLAWLPESSIVTELAEGKLIWAGSNRWSLTLEIRLFRAIDNKNAQLASLWEFLRKQEKAVAI